MLIKKIVQLLLCVSVSLAITSCSDDDDNNPTTDGEIVGFWESTVNDNNLYESLWFTDNRRVEYYCKDSQSDGQYVVEATGTYHILGDQLSITYDHVRVDGGQYHNGFLNGTTSYVSYTIFNVSGNTLTLIENDLYGTKHVFKLSEKGGGSSNDDPHGGGSDDPDPNSIEAKIIGDWRGTDGYDVINASFKKNGYYSDAIFENGENKYPLSCTYTITGNKIHFNGECNMVNSWNNDFTITFNGSNKMVWVNETLQSWGETWVFEKI